jgi:hypothetical protein
MKLEWNKVAMAKGINCKMAGAKLIVDNIIAYATTCKIALIKYVRHILDSIQHYRATIKLKKCNRLHPCLCFVGVDISGEGNLPTRDKHVVSNTITHPITFKDLRMLIEMSGFYLKWLLGFEL